ncbi:Dabb family protein [Duganella vulcania]|uniref:Dabb family protein n=1 Tax=Duganella vulcania TaxID=2692166 RepID=A0A845GM47_9BURK|nr:Dabb family protein [Duganella vulcania]MYM94198.1 Dabb family protein [Duganella vulcania]
MIKHIVMWKLKDHAEGADRAANAAKMKTLLEGCVGLVPGLLKLEAVVAQPGLEATYDVMMYSEFTDKAALDEYQNHPDHVAIKPFFAAVRDARQCMDYEI